MLMKTGERWHCTNPLCRCQILVAQSGELDGHNPVCACGSPLKKKYVSPLLTYLELLHIEEPAISIRESQND